MCLAVPGKIIKREADEAVVDLHGSQIAVSAALVPDAGLGDWVLIHAGFAIQQLSCTDAEETFAVLEDIRRLEQA